MSDIAIRLDFSGLVIGAEVVAFMLVFISAWSRRCSKARGAFIVAMGVMLMIAAAFLVPLE